MSISRVDLEGRSKALSTIGLKQSEGHMYNRKKTISLIWLACYIYFGLPGLTVFAQDQSPFPLIPDPKQQHYAKLGRQPMPCTLFVDHSGKILSVHYGAGEDTDKFDGELMDSYQKVVKGSDSKDCSSN